MTRKQKLEILQRIAAGEPLSLFNNYGFEIALRVQETGQYFMNGCELSPEQVVRFNSNRNNKIITIDLQDLNA